MGLFKPAWESANKEKALKAVEKLTNQTKLKVIAKNTAIFGAVRFAATIKVDDQMLAQEMFADIAKNDNNSNVRYRAVSKLDDQSLLAGLAFSNDKSVRMVVAGKLADTALAQKIYASIAEHCILFGFGYEEEAALRRQCC